jgi:hypothetical protein
VSANIYRGGIIGANPVGRSGIWGVGDAGITYKNVETYSATVLNDGAVGFWLLNETSGSTAFDLAGAYDLTYLNTPTLGDPGPGSEFLPLAATFNGTDENAKGDNSATFTSSSSGNWSIECWLRYTSTSATLTPLMLRDTVASTGTVTGNIIVNNTTAGVISAQFPSSALTIVQLNAGGGFNNGAWHHVVLTAASSGSARLYVNGTEVAASSTARATSSTQRSVTVGSNRAGVSSYIQYFPGSVAACAVYLNTLSAAQISRHNALGRF